MRSCLSHHVVRFFADKLEQETCMLCFPHLAAACRAGGLTGGAKGRAPLKWLAGRVVIYAFSITLERRLDIRHFCRASFVTSQPMVTACSKAILHVPCASTCKIDRDARPSCSERGSAACESKRAAHRNTPLNTSKNSQAVRRDCGKANCDQFDIKNSPCWYCALC